MDTYEKERRLSIPRVLLALVLITVLCGTYFYRKSQVVESSSSTGTAWYAGYVDVTVTPTFAFQQMGGEGSANAVLAFIVSLPGEPCTPSWGAAYTMDQANASLSLDPRIARLQQRGGSVAVSFGGRDNNELAVVCTDVRDLTAAYRSVVNRYKVDTVDLDLEDATLADSVSGKRRAQAIAALQTERRKEGKSLAVWLTLAVTPQGMSESGTSMVSLLLENKVDLAGINVMTMDYGASLQPGQSMGDASKSALTQAHRQLGILYQKAGIYLSDEALWRKMGATPMVGQNDFAGEIFNLEDAKALNAFALEKKIGRMSLWSANRDIACGSNYVNVKAVSNSCSGVRQDPEQFAAYLRNGFDSSISEVASVVTESGEAPKQDEIVDDPNHSPYQIWTKEGVYLQGTKVVWRKNIYQAKWWTQGASPDDPVLQTWQTPWELLGPVMPDDVPIPQPTLPSGTYPEWDGTSIYNAEQRVLFSGVPYQAKWWNQGNSPAAAESNPNGSPWTPLTQEQINEIISRKY